MKAFDVIIVYIFHALETLNNFFFRFQEAGGMGSLLIETWGKWWMKKVEAWV